MPQRLSLKGIDFQGALLICGLMLVVSYIVVYGDYFMWLDTFRIRLLIGVAIVLFGIVLYRLHYYRYPYVELSLFTQRNVVPILIVTFFAELAFGAEHTMEEILYGMMLRSGNDAAMAAAICCGALQGASRRSTSSRR